MVISRIHGRTSAFLTYVAHLSAVLSVVVLAFFADEARAQDAMDAGVDEQARSCDTAAGHQLDFWLGEWDLTWTGGQGGTPEGETGRGTNTITRTLDDCVIEEQFRMPGFEGMSVSVFATRTNDWRQTWVDSQGGYIALRGGMIDRRMELRTQPFTNPAGDEQVNRMIWTNVTQDSLDWTWQRSLDGGVHWEDTWLIHYVRRGPNREDATTRCFTARTKEWLESHANPHVAGACERIPAIPEIVSSGERSVYY